MTEQQLTGAVIRHAQTLDPNLTNWDLLSQNRTVCQVIAALAKNGGFDPVDETDPEPIDGEEPAADAVTAMAETGRVPAHEVEDMTHQAEPSPLADQLPDKREFAALCHGLKPEETSPVTVMNTIGETLKMLGRSYPDQTFEGLAVYEPELILIACRMLGNGETPTAERLAEESAKDE